MSPIIVWSIIFGLLMALAYYVTRLAGGNQERKRIDTGLAILQFGRAFPGEAIRSLHVTADGEAIFLRLDGGKAGLMRNRGNHYSCHVFAPGGVRLTPLADSRGFTVDFPHAPTQSGSFRFASPAEAAEVSLWLLDALAVTVQPAAQGFPERAS